MKKILFLLAVSALAFSCTEQKNGAVITGKADNLADGFFILGGPGGSRDTVKLDDKGNFKIDLSDITESGNYYVLSGNDHQFFQVAPGMKLELNFDKSNFATSFKFTGKGSDINNYVIEKSKVKGNQDYEFFKLEADRFRVKIDSLLAVYQGILRSTQKDDATDAFWTTEETELLFDWANQLYMFQFYHPYFAQLTDYKVPEGFMDFMKDVNINNPAYVKSQQYQSFISQYINGEASERAKAITAADSTAKPDEGKLALEVAKEKLTEPAALSVYLYNTASDGMQWKDLSEVQTTIDLFRATCKDQEMIAKFDKTYNEWKRLEKGQPAFDFSGKDMQGNTVKLSDFKGKYVYVDVWATWCGPCKYEIPYLDTLETDYHGRNVVFISYSIDEDHAAWMKFVPEKNLQGVQIIGEKAWESQLCKDYKIRGVPTFMFFDPEGKIISVKMTRPSDKKTRETFDSLF